MWPSCRTSGADHHESWRTVPERGCPTSGASSKAVTSQPIASKATSRITIAWSQEPCLMATWRWPRLIVGRRRRETSRIYFTQAVTVTIAVFHLPTRSWPPPDQPSPPPPFLHHLQCHLPPATPKRLQARMMMRNSRIASSKRTSSPVKRHPANDINGWLPSRSSLTFLMRGAKKDRNRLQHTSHIRTILEDLEPSGRDIEVLSNDEGYIVWPDWVDPKMSTLKSGTIKSCWPLHLTKVPNFRNRGAGAILYLTPSVGRLPENLKEHNTEASWLAKDCGPRETLSEIAPHPRGVRLKTYHHWCPPVLGLTHRCNCQGTLWARLLWQNPFNACPMWSQGLSSHFNHATHRCQARSLGKRDSRWLPQHVYRSSDWPFCPPRRWTQASGRWASHANLRCGSASSHGYLHPVCTSPIPAT